MKTKMISFKWPMSGMLGALLLFAVSGCVGHLRPSLEESVRSSRRQAFRDWQEKRRRSEDDAAVLSGSLTLQDAINLALTRNPSLLAVLEEREVARGRVWESYSEALPSVSLSGEYRRLDEVGGFDVAGRTVVLGFEDNYSVGLHVRQPVFRGGAIPAALRAGQMVALLSDEHIRGAIQATIFVVAKEYFDARLAGHLYTVNKDAVVSAKAHLDDVRKRHAEGLATDYDVLRAQVDVSNFEAEMIRQRNRLDLSRARLLKTMGVSQESTVEIVDPLTFEPVRPVFEEAVRLAHLRRPDLHTAEWNVRLQKEALRLARSRYWPRVDAIFTERWSRPDPHSMTTDEWGSSWFAGMSLDYPLFDGLRREGKMIQEKARLRQRWFELQDTEHRALLEVQEAVLTLRNAEEFVASQKLNLKRAQEALRLVRTGYREGVNTEVEVSDARAALTRASGLYYQAIYSHVIARLALQRAMGTLGPEPGDAEVPHPYKRDPQHIDAFDGSAAAAAPGSSGQKDAAKTPAAP